MSSITAYFSIATPEQIKEQDQRGLEVIRHAKRWKKARELAADSQKAQHDRDLAAERQRKHRQKVREGEAKQGLRDPITLRKRKRMTLEQESPEPETSPQLPERPSKRSHATQTDFFEPARWTLISIAAKRIGFKHSGAIVHELQKGTSGALFKTLHRGTLSHWINKERTGWTQTALDRAARAAQAHQKCITPRVAGPGKKLGRPARLDPYPNVVKNIVKLLKNLRAVGVLITRAVAQSVALAFIRADAPKLFHDDRFKCSESFIRRLLHNELNWSWRTVTQAASKLPANWEDVCIDLAHRLVWNIVLHKVPAELVINADQTGVSYLGTGTRTWELKGSKQVAAVGQGEKRQFTLMAAITAAGQVLPYQAIYKGWSNESLPSPQAQKSCDGTRFVFTAGGAKHWSSLETMQKWVLEVLVPFIERERRRLGLPYTQRAILVIDCWSVHRGKPFRDWVKKSFPWLLILFIPGGCTSVAQPCDTNVNRVLKHLIKSSCVEYLSEVTQKQLRKGIKPADVEIDTTPATLRNASVDWLVSSWNWLNDHPEVVLDAWRRAQFREWNLSYDFLTSSFSRETVRERFAEDQEFALSIVDIAQQTPDDPEFEEEDSPDHDDDYAIDPRLLCDIRGAPGGSGLGSALPNKVVEYQGDLLYAGDEYLTDSEDEDCYEYQPTR